MPDGPYEPERDRIEACLGGMLLRARTPPSLGEEAPVLFVAYLRHRARRRREHVRHQEHIAHRRAPLHLRGRADKVTTWKVSCNALNL
jgi:hypothetical protein